MPPDQPTLARDVMQAAPMTVAMDAPLRDVLHHLVVAQIGGVPILDGEGTVVAMLSATDLLRAVDQLADDDVDPGEPAAGVGELAEQLGGMTVAEVATPEVVWVTPTTPVSQIAKLMRARGIHRVVVGTDGRLEGIVTTFDLLALLE